MCGRDDAPPYGMPDYVERVMLLGSLGREGIPVRVLTTDPELARQAGPLVAEALYPDRHFGEVIHLEALDAESFEVIVRDRGAL